MKKLTDQELDAIFKEAAEGHQPAYDPSAWETMAGKLDQPAKKIVWTNWMTYLLLGSLIFVAGVWIGTTLTKNENVQLLNQSEIGAVKEVIDKNLNNEKQVEQEKDALASKNENTSEVNSNAIDNRVRANEYGTSTAVKKTNNQVFDSSRIPVAEEELLAVEIIRESKEDEAIEINKSDDALNELDSVWVKEGVQKEQVPDSVLSVDSVRVKEEGQMAKPIFVRALVSPDFSSINFASTTSIGTNYALLFEYPITRNLFISSGAIWSTKVYSSANEIVYGKYTADGVEGTCRILDVPIYVYYMFNSPGKFSFFAGAGASSYFMVSEEYTFYINTNSGKREFDWSFKGDNIDWFKMLNLSAGVQYQLSNQFYLQAEPFVKVPLSGIGEWDIDLSSFGVFMGLKYRLNK